MQGLMRVRGWRMVCGVWLGLSAVGCASPSASFDYQAWRAAKPASILILPPINQSPDVLATPSVWAQLTLPLAEAGYYVVPVSLVDETLRNQGVHNAALAQHIAQATLRKIFGADAALYVTIQRYGSVYKVLSSDTTVTLAAQLIDLRDGQVLWHGTASASGAEQNQAQQGGIVSLLLQALVEQVVASKTERSHPIAGIAVHRLLHVGPPRGVLAGPRLPLDGAAQ